MTVHGKVLPIIFVYSFIATVADTGGRLALWYHVYGSLTAKIIQTNNIIAREANLTPLQPSIISYDVYALWLKKVKKALPSSYPRGSITHRARHNSLDTLKKRLAKELIKTAHASLRDSRSPIS